VAFTEHISEGHECRPKFEHISEGYECRPRSEHISEGHECRPKSEHIGESHDEIDSKEKQQKMETRTIKQKLGPYICTFLFHFVARELYYIFNTLVNGEWLLYNDK
jgi:hypothetical protein